MFYYLLKYPESYRKLQAEFDEVLPAKEPNSATYPGITFTQAQKLRCLDACIKEAFRMHPVARFIPEQVVPASGHTICGEHIPGGTVVGVSAWVMHRNANIFGEDVDDFRPERWFGDAEKLKEMDRMLLHFGFGHYTCLGKNIGLLEMYKLVPAVLRHFEVRIHNIYTSSYYR